MPFIIDPPPVPPAAPPADEDAALWEQLYEALGFHREADPNQGDALRKFCEAWSAPLEPAYEIVRERTDGTASWGVLFDPDRCPAESLPYLAQYVGVVITPEMSEQQIREEIAQPTGWSRGQEASIRIACQRTLTGARRVTVRPRTPAPGFHYIRTLLLETPEPARTEAVLRRSLAAWEVLDYEAVDGVAWEDVAATWEGWSTITSTFVSWADLADTLPEELI
ncbi:MAG TPA: phage tail protein [Solirubrobacterales bacterium]|nr:phage tail protein [Solirubrobacterales bacterium]